MVAVIFLINLLATILIEGLVMLLLFRRWDFVYYTCLCNLLTNPALNLLLLTVVHVWGTGFYAITLALGEVMAVLLEGIVLSKLCLFSFKKALAISLLMNAASFLAGLIWAVV
jgi:hypothetical protein